ncbi:MAG: hypothetical protein WBC22_13675 [Sedimentisphaerales bacterium]
MRTENKKTALIISLTVSALVIGVMPHLGQKLVLQGIWSKEEGFWAFFWLYGLHFNLWGWFLGLCFAIAALVGTRHWKPSTPLLKGIVIIFSVIAVLMPLIWLGMLIVLSQFSW